MTNSTLLVDYLGQGVAASRPAAPSAATSTLTFYYATDTLQLSYYDWNTAAWVNVTTGASNNPIGGVNAQTGVTYTIADTDLGMFLTLSNAGAIAVTLPQAGTGNFTATWFVFVKNFGAGTATITPTTSTINGAATLVLTTGLWATIFSNGTNYVSFP